MQEEEDIVDEEEGRVEKKRRSKMIKTITYRYPLPRSPSHLPSFLSAPSTTTLVMPRAHQL
jgi:hypothetical protein